MFRVLGEQKLQEPQYILNEYKKKGKYMDDYYQLFIKLPGYFVTEEVDAQKIRNLSLTRNEDLKKLFFYYFEQYLQEFKCHDLAESLCSYFFQKDINIYSNAQLEKILSHPENPKYNLSPEIVNIISKLELSDKQILATEIAVKLNIEIENSEDYIDSEENSIDKIKLSFEKSIKKIIEGVNNVIFFGGSSAIDELKKALRENNIPLIEEIYLKDKDFTVLSGLGASIPSGACDLDHGINQGTGEDPL